MEKFVKWVIAHRKIVLATCAIITVFLAAQIRGLSIIIDADNQLPQQHPYVMTNNLVEKIFGNKFTMVVGVTAKEGTIYQTAILEKVQRITNAVREVPGVVKNKINSLAVRKAKSIEGTSDGMAVYPLLEKIPENEAQMEKLRSAVKANPVYENLLVSTNEKTTQVIFEMKPVSGNMTAVVSEIQKIAQAEKDAITEITVGGAPVFLSLAEKYSARMGLFFPLALLIIGLIHYEAFRTRQALLLPLVTAVLAVIWSLGGLALLKQPLDVFNASTPILILAVAAGHAVQILKRYYEEFARISKNEPQLSPIERSRKAVLDSLTKVGPVMIVACSVAAIGFFSLVIFEIKTIQTFGLFTAAGIVSALILELTFIPALRCILPAPSKREISRESQKSIWDSIIEKLFFWVMTKRKTLYISTGLIVFILSLGGYWVKVENSLRIYYDKNLEAKMDDARINEQMGGSSMLVVMVEGQDEDSIKDPAVLQGMQRIQDLMAADPIVGKTISIVDFIKRMNQAVQGGGKEFYSIPDSKDLVGQYLFLYSNSGEPGDFDTYVDNSYQKALIQIFMKTDNSNKVSALLRKLEDFAAGQFGPGIKVSVGGATSGGVALNEVMTRGKILNIIQIMFVVFLISSIVFRSPLAGLLMLVPLVAAVMVNFGIMGLLGIPLQFATAVVSAMAVGIGADYGIYMTYRMREELKAGGNEPEALRRAFLSAGKAVLFVSTAIAGGFGVLMFSFGFLAHIWMGFLISVATLVSSFSALTLFPALIFSLRPQFIFGKSSESKGKAAAAMIPFILGFLFQFFHASPAQAQGTLSAEEIMKKNYIISRVNDSASQAVFRLVNASGQERVRTTKAFTKLVQGSTDNMRLVTFESPADIKGTKTLLIEHSGQDDDIWIYLPALKKVRRLVSSNKRDSFAGTDFSYGDIIGHKVAEWKHTLLKEEKLEGKDVFVIQSTPKDDNIKESSGYSKRVLWIDKETFVLVKSESYDMAGALYKRSLSSKFVVVDAKNNKLQPMLFEMANLQTQHKTIIEYRQFKANVGVSKDLFTARYLEK